MENKKTAEADAKPRRGEFARRKGEVILREHEYDGIQEFDQKLPNWWLFTLYIAIAWSGVHWFLHYHTGLLQTDAERMAEWSAKVAAAKAAELDEILETLDDETLVSDWSTDPGRVASGQATYSTVCVACHAPDLSATLGGTPLPGLPLNDREWKFGGRPMEIFNLIKDGSPPESEGHNGAKMTPWSQVLPPEKIAELTAFIISENRQEFPLP